MNKKNLRIKRSRESRNKISKLNINRLSIHRTNLHIYANIFSPKNKNLVFSSTVESEVKNILKNKSGLGGNINAAKIIGERIAKKALVLGIKNVAFDRSGFLYHGRIKTLAQAAREAGLKF